jgi:integrase
MAYRQRNKGFQLDITHKGKRYRTQILGDATDAKAAEAHCEKGLNEGKSWQLICKELDLARKDLSIGAIFSQMQHKWNDPHGLRTAKNLVTQIGIHKKITTIDEEVIDNLIEDWKSNGNADSTCNRKLAALSKILSHAKKRNYIKSKPEIEWFIEGSGRIRYFKKDEEKRFLDILSNKEFFEVYDLTAVGIDTGARKSELKRIDQQRDIDGRMLTIMTTKAKAPFPRYIELTDRSLKILSRCGRYPFAGISDEHLRKAWNYGKIKLGLQDDKQFTFHCTRHTFASRLVQAGIGITVIQELMGHKTIKMTLRYAHLAPRNKTEARKALENYSDRSGDNVAKVIGF